MDIQARADPKCSIVLYRKQLPLLLTAKSVHISLSREKKYSHGLILNASQTPMPFIFSPGI